VRTVCLLVLSALAASAQQQPSTPPSWPCTGTEQSFDPAYSKVAEASGGHLFLANRSEPLPFLPLANGDAKHKATLMRATGKLESYKDIQVPVDSTVESLFVVISIQCMQAAQIFDPQGTTVRADLQEGGEDHWYRAGRIAVIPKPAPGQWTLRLTGGGYYSYAVQARTAVALHVSFDAASGRLRASLSDGFGDAEFHLVRPTGEIFANGNAETEIAPGTGSFRVSVSGRDTAGFPVVRTDARLFQRP
jgi:hypothetical protein